MAPTLLGAVLTLVVSLVLVGVPAHAEDATETEPLSALTVSAVDASGAPVPGVGFALWAESNDVTGLQQPGDTDLAMPCTTDGAGTCTVGAAPDGTPSLPLGSYYWVQTATPDGYQAPVEADQPRGTVSVTAANAGTAIAPTVVTLVAEQDASTTADEETDQSSEETDQSETASSTATTTTTDPDPSPLLKEQSTDGSSEVTSLGGPFLLQSHTAACHDGAGAWPAVGSPVAKFEIDGNLCLNDSTYDWANVGGQPAGKNDGYGAGDGSRFTQGADESNWPWSVGQMGGTGSGQNNSRDIGDVYAWTQTLGGNVYAYFGFEREFANGSVAHYVELNAEPNDCPTSAPCPRPDRTQGDVRLVFNQTGNETISLVRADTWGGSGWVSSGSLAGFVGQVNQDMVTNLSGTSLGKGRFAEVGVNLSSLFESTCTGNFGTLNVRSTSSPSDTSNLDDWIAPINLSVPSTCSSVEVTKSWVIDGKDYEHGDQPNGFTASPTLDPGPANPEFGVEYDSDGEGDRYEKDDVVTVGETVDVPPGCTNVASGDTGQQTLDVGLNTFEITNTVTCTRLTLIKKVTGEGPADPTDWTLADATEWTLKASGGSPASTIEGKTGDAEVTAARVAPGTYALTESGGPLGYELESLVCTPGSVSNGQVTVQQGTHVTCTFTNDWLVPGISIVKQAWDTADETLWQTATELVSDSFSVISGTTITWTYLVENTGETTLSDILVTDDQLGDSRTGSPPPITCPSTSLDVGESMTCTASGEVTAD